MTDYYFDMDGQPIDLLEWGRRMGDMDARTVALDDIPNGTLRTVWLGFVDHSSCARLFGTAAKRDNIVELEQYDTKAEALAGHQRHLDQLWGRGQ